jgi:hypothetical protein
MTGQQVGVNFENTESRLFEGFQLFSYLRCFHPSFEFQQEAIQGSNQGERYVL